MKYVYFVSWVRVVPNSLQTGMSEIITRLPITTFVQIRDVQFALEAKNGTTITILTYQLLSKESAIA